MTASDLADVLAAQRAAYRPAHVPPFTEVTHRKRHRDLRKRVALGGVVAAAVAATGLVALALALSPADTVQGGVAAGPSAPRPDEQRLQEAFAPLTPSPPFFSAVEQTPAGEFVLGDLPRQQGEGVRGETSDKTTSVLWTVLSPPLTEAEVVDMAGSVSGSSGDEPGAPVSSTADQSGALRSVAYRFGDGSFLAIWAWAADGGVVTLTSGAGATTTDNEVLAWESAVRSLLAQRNPDEYFAEYRACVARHGLNVEPVDGGFVISAPPDSVEHLNRVDEECKQQLRVDTSPRPRN